MLLSNESDGFPHYSISSDFVCQNHLLAIKGPWVVIYQVFVFTCSLYHYMLFGLYIIQSYESELKMI